MSDEEANNGTTMPEEVYEWTKMKLKESRSRWIMENPALHMIDKVIRDLQSVKTWIHKDDLNKIESALKIKEVLEEKININSQYPTISFQYSNLQLAQYLQLIIDESEKWLK